MLHKDVRTMHAKGVEGSESDRALVLGIVAAALGVSVISFLLALVQDVSAAAALVSAAATLGLLMAGAYGLATWRRPVAAEQQIGLARDLRMLLEAAREAVAGAAAEPKDPLVLFPIASDLFIRVLDGKEQLESITTARIEQEFYLSKAQAIGHAAKVLEDRKHEIAVYLGDEADGLAANARNQLQMLFISLAQKYVEIGAGQPIIAPDVRQLFAAPLEELRMMTQTPFAPDVVAAVDKLRKHLGQLSAA